MRPFGPRHKGDHPQGEDKYHEIASHQFEDVHAKTSTTAGIRRAVPSGTPPCMTAGFAVSRLASNIYQVTVEFGLMRSRGVSDVFRQWPDFDAAPSDDLFRTVPLRIVTPRRKKPARQHGIKILDPDQQSPGVISRPTPRSISEAESSMA